MRVVRLAFLLGLLAGALALRTVGILWPSGPSSCDTAALEQRVYVLETRLDGHEDDDAVLTYYELNGIR